MAASEGAPPGYARSPALNDAPASDTGQLALARFVLLALATLGMSVDQLALRQVSAYLLPASAPSANVSHALVLGLGVLGALGAARAGAGFGALALALSLESLCVSASGALWFWAISRGWLFSAVAWALPAACGLLCGVALASCLRAFGRAARGLDVLGYSLRPSTVAFAAPALVAYAALGAQIGLWRSAAALGLVLAALASYVPTLAAFLRGRALGRRHWLRALGAGCALCALASYALARRALPSSALGVFPGDVVWRSASEPALTLVSVQQSLELYGERELRLTSADATRYAEALVHPALALAPRRARVLLLGLASGIAEREILRYPELERLSSVSAELELSRLVRENHELSRLAGGAFASAKLRLIEAEPIVWLERSSERFDVIVIDMPDPSGYLEGKYYTRFFYRCAYEHLSEDGVLVTQATSPSSSPESLASIARSVAAAGFEARAYAAAVPMLGEWGFVLGARGALVDLTQLPASTRAVLRATRYLDEPALALALATPLPLSPKAAENTLFHQPLVETLAEERRARGF